MRDTKRIDILIEALKKVWKEVPDWRLGQLLINIVKPTGSCPELFYVEDDILLERLEVFLKDCGAFA